jgi:hypothetical protein
MQRTVFGIDASGQQLGAPTGQLDVWIPVPKLAEAMTVGETTIRDTLEKLRPPGNKEQLAAAKPPDWDSWGPGRKAAWSKKQNTGENYWFRFSEPVQAEPLVHQLKEWVSAGHSHSDGTP